MLKSSTRSLVSRIALALMLFAQGAMAWSACALPERAPELALQAAAEHAGCEQMAAMQGAAASVCLAHCLAEKQSLDKPAAVDIPAMPSAVVLVVPGPFEAITLTETRALAITAGTGPPRRILLQSFQI